MSTDTPASGRVRTSDTEREQVAEILRAAATEGRLTLAESDERLGRAYAARYRDELAPLTADLPSGGWEALYRTPEALAGMRRRLRRHGSFTAVLIGALIGLWLLSGAHFFWPLIPIFFLTFGFLRHASWARWRASGGGPWGPNRQRWSRW
ncbi:MAG: DUF1707 domain-containing protein [Actinobacteria bacterium]|nr:MAG: DUF1707 domain-containing protein [Actinomycetota bacterium]